MFFFVYVCVCVFALVLACAFVCTLVSVACVYTENTAPPPTLPSRCHCAPPSLAPTSSGGVLAHHLLLFLPTLLSCSASCCLASLFLAPDSFIVSSEQIVNYITFSSVNYFPAFASSFPPVISRVPVDLAFPPSPKLYTVYIFSSAYFVLGFAFPLSQTIVIFFLCLFCFLKIVEEKSFPREALYVKGRTRCSITRLCARRCHGIFQARTRRSRLLPGYTIQNMFLTDTEPQDRD